MKSSIRDYSAKVVFVGIDVHKKSYAICCICEGEMVKKCTMTADPHACAESLRKWFKGASIKSVYEAGFSGFVLHRSLERNGIENIVVNPASVESAKNDRVKTDAIDSLKLAKQLSLGNLKANFVPTEEEELSRQYQRTREQYVKKRVRVGNQIKSKLFLFGLVEHSDAKQMGPSYFKKIEKMILPPELDAVIQIMIEEWRFLHKQVLIFDKIIKIQNEKMKVKADIIKSVPGLGDLTANVLLTELGDMSRFSNERQLSSFVGLTPSEHSSGESIQRGRITRMGPPTIRKLLTQNAWVAIKNDQSLRDIYDRIALRAGHKKAIVAIARKLLGRIRSCLAQNVAYKAQPANNC